MEISIDQLWHQGIKSKILFLWIMIIEQTVLNSLSFWNPSLTSCLMFGYNNCTDWWGWPSLEAWLARRRSKQRSEICFSVIRLQWVIHLWEKLRSRTCSQLWFHSWSVLASLWTEAGWLGRLRTSTNLPRPTDCPLTLTLHWIINILHHHHRGPQK